MSIKSGVCRLAFSFLDKGFSRRNISSAASKCVSSISPSSNVVPLLSANYLRAPSHKPELIDPSLVKMPKSILDVPLARITRILDVPSIPVVTTIPSITPVAIEDPTKVIEKQAARLIVIRRAKMRRHKLKKLRIKMKFYWAKERQKRELKKEKLFQAELMGKIREAEKFDAAVYVINKINKANEVLLPKLWKGKRLPEFVIKELIERKQRKMQENKERKARREKMPRTVAEYNV